MSTNLQTTQTELRNLVEEAAAKERRILGFSMVFTLIAFIGGGLWMWYAYHQVRTLDRQYAQKIADQNSLLQIKDNAIRDKEGLLDERQRQLNRLESDIAQRQQNINDLNKYYASLVGKISSGNKQESESIVKESLETNPQVAGIIPRIYIQIGRDDQRGRAQKVQQELQNHGYLAPGIENVGAKSQGKTVLKYFHSREEPEAKQTVELLQGWGVKIGPPLYIGGFEASTKMRARHYEVWFGADF